MNLQNVRVSILLSTFLTLSTAMSLAIAETKVVMLGTGTPMQNAERAGSSVAVVYNGQAYVFDAGGGMVQRAIEAHQRLGFEALKPSKIEHLFFTHLHSDHVLDYPELVGTNWWGRPRKLKAYGPVGLQTMTDAVYGFLAPDIKLRTLSEQPLRTPGSHEVEITEIKQQGLVLGEDKITVEAFTVNHGDIKPAYGYKVTTPDKVVVISGDTSYSENLIKHAKGADVLIHEVMSETGWSNLPDSWRAYHGASHTLTSQLADIAKKTKPGLLVLTHVLRFGIPIETVKEEVEFLYDGEVILANDLDVF